MRYSLLDKANLLEYTRNLVAYDIDKGKKIKKLNELGEPMQPKESEIPVLERHHRSVMRIFEGIDSNDYEALLKAIEPEDVRTKFDRAYTDYV